MATKRKFNKTAPPCPDHSRYTLVRGKFGYYWRLKRGTIKPAVLNDVLKRSAAITGKTNRAAKEMMALLAAFTQGMSLGDSVTRIAGAFKKSYLQTGKMDFQFLEKFNFQEDYRIYKLYTGGVHTRIEKSSIVIRSGIGDFCVKRPSRFALGYQLKALMLYGNPAKERGILIETDESPTYSFGQLENDYCELSFVLPAKPRPWIILLHVGCLVAKPAYGGAKYQALMVVKTG